MGTPDPVYYDMARNEQRTTWDEAYAAAERVKAFFDLVAARFPGRQEVMDKMMYALMTRHHLLMTGPHGTAKTLMINTVLRAIQGDKVALWSDQMTQHHTPEDLFGPLNIRVYRETGRPEHIIEDTLSTATHARIGELMDANDFTLRAMLGALHEREVRLGLDVVRNPLMTAFADTNFRLEDEPSRVKKLAALWDRFLFQVDVAYLVDPGQRIAMFNTALGNTHTQPLSAALMFNDLVLVSGLVHRMNLVRDPYVVSAWEEATRGFRQQQLDRNAIPVSDRRLVQAMIIMEVHALLRGRPEVNFEDVDEARLVLCGHEADTKYFDDEVPPIVGSWVERGLNRELEAERAEVQVLLDRLPTIDIAPMESEHELTELMGEVDEVLRQLQGFSAKHAVVRKEIADHIVHTEERLAEIQMRLIHVLNSSLPDISSIEDDGDIVQLKAHHGHVGTVSSTVNTLTPVRDRVRTFQRETVARCIELRARIAEASGLAVGG